MNRITKFLTSIVFAGMLLSGCTSQPEDTSASYVDLTPTNPYGQISEFSVENGDLEAGASLSFKVTSSSDFFIDKILVSGIAVATETENKTSDTYTITLAKGVNRISAAYRIDPTIDFVDRFKLSQFVDAATFYSVMSAPETMDFRVDGIEQMTTTALSESAFVNYVDGDTTHVETLHYGYTVKIRYLSIDTPESTSEIEEWGKSAALYNKECLSNATRIVLMSQGWARGDEDKAATADGNQRSLAYLWYTESEAVSPARDDFKCLNLEMVYEGFSQGIGSIEDSGPAIYYAFDKANKSAEANKRHIYSDAIDSDPCYDYDGPTTVTLKDIYTHTTMTTAKPYSISCSYIDTVTEKQNLFKVHGFVSRKLDGAFYIQDKASYDQVADTTPEAYGMYVFTYAQTPIAVGDEVNVVGALSIYSGTLQLQGISYHDFDTNPDRDTIIVSSGHDIVPITLTAAEFAATKYDFVLVRMADDIFGYTKINARGIHSEGGIHEINEYNEKYPFYNTSNKLTTFGKVGSVSGADLRVTICEGVFLTYGKEISYSHKFLGGGTTYYSPADANYIYDKTPSALEADSAVFKEVYTTKTYSLVGISGNYISTSGATQAYQMNVVNAGDIVIKSAVAA